MDIWDLASGDGRAPTWAERDHLAALRNQGVEDVYVDLKDASQAWWEALVLATNWCLASTDEWIELWDDWDRRFRWATGLPSAANAYANYTYRQVVLSGLYRTGSNAGHPMSVGQRITAVEMLLDALDGTPDEFATAVNERAAFLRVGVRLEGQRFLPLSSGHLHKEVVTPALLLLANPEYGPVDALYRKAFERVLAGDRAGGITAATSSVEEMLRILLCVTGLRLQPVLQRARGEGWLIPAVEQLAMKLDALRSESDAHTVGTDQTHVAMLGIHVAGSLIVHLAEARRGGASGATA